MESKRPSSLASSTLLLLLIFPAALCLWMMSYICHTIFGTISISPVRWFSAFLVPIIFSIGGYKRNSLSASGAITGFFIGAIITLSNYGFLLCLICFFVSSSKATKYKKDLKAKIENDFREGGQRNWAQVLSNGIVAAVFAILYIIDCGCSEQLLDFQTNYRCSWLSAAFLGSLCCCNGDTWASEFGSVLSVSNPRLITTLSEVPRGTNGGVSVIGLIVSFMGGCFVSLGYLISLWVFVSPAAFASSPQQLSIVLLGGIAGLIGSLIDSVLGATLQFSGMNVKGQIVEHPGPDIKHISGLNVLGNHTVNLVSNIMTAIITPYIAAYLF